MRFGIRLLVSIGALASVASMLAAPSLASGSAHAKVLTSVKVTISKANEFKFTLSKTSVPRSVVTFTIANGGVLPHDFKVCSSNKGSLTATSCNGKGTALIQPGKTGKLVVTFLLKGKYEYLCTVSGHAAAGMKGLLTVT